MAVTGYIFAAAAVVFCPGCLRSWAVPGHFVHDPGDLSPGAWGWDHWTAYYIVTDQMELASRTGFSAVKAAVAIVLGIIFVFEIPRAFVNGSWEKKTGGGNRPEPVKCAGKEKRIQVFTDFSQYAIMQEIYLKNTKGWFLQWQPLLETWRNLAYGDGLDDKKERRALDRIFYSGEGESTRRSLSDPAQVVEGNDRKRSWLKEV